MRQSSSASKASPPLVRLGDSEAAAAAAAPPDAGTIEHDRRRRMMTRPAAESPDRPPGRLRRAQPEGFQGLGSEAIRVQSDRMAKTRAQVSTVTDFTGG